MDAGFSYGEADRWLGARATLERTCPVCSHSRKPAHRKAPCFGLKRSGADRIVYACMNCGIEGVVTDGWGERPPQRPRAQSQKLTSPINDNDDRQKREEWAGQVWRSSVNPAGTIAETYWLTRGLALPLPPSVRFQPRLKHAELGFAPALIVAAGLAEIAGEDWHPVRVAGIQRIFLEPDGLKHIGKKSLGTIKGAPMVVHVNLESLALVIGEGVEKTAALAQSMNVDGWASGGLSFLVHLAPLVPTIFEVVTVIVDPGDAAKEACAGLAEGLADRGFEVAFTHAWQ